MAQGRKGQLKALLSKKKRRLEYIGVNNRRGPMFQAEGNTQHWITSFRLTQTVSVRKTNPRRTKSSNEFHSQSQQHPQRKTLSDGGGNMRGVFHIISKLARSFLWNPATDTQTVHISCAAGNIWSEKSESHSRDHEEMLAVLHLSSEQVLKGWRKTICMAL